MGEHRIYLDEDCPAVSFGGDQSIYLRKDIGPTIFCDLKIRADIETAEWVISVQHINQDDAGNDVVSWEERYRIDAQETIFGED